MSLAVIIGLLSASIVACITYFKWKFSFWKRKNLYFVEPSIPFGTFGNVINRSESPGEVYKRLHLALKARGLKHGGTYFFSSPEYMPIDPEYIKCILSKDFQHFKERGLYYNEKDEPLSANLFLMGGEKWRILRSKLTQTFTSGKIKTMFDIILRCSNQMLEAIEDGNVTALDVKDLTARYTTDVIGNCAFGLDCNSFKSSDAEIRKYGRKFFAPIGYLHNIAVVVAFINHDWGRKLGVRSFPNDVNRFFTKLIRDTVEYRKKHNVNRNDMLKLMLDLRNDPENHLTMDEIAAQAFMFFAAGFDSSSSTMTYCLYEISKNTIIQDKIREEISSVLSTYGNEVTYEAVQEMKYLHQVVSETLRKYPTLPFITRQCVEDYHVPNTGVVIPKGVMVVISAFGIHYDPEYYPRPDKFDPDRFLPDVAEKRPRYSYIPFGEGPRICIGIRFGMLQMKLGLIKLLQKYKFTTNSQTVKSIKFHYYNLTLSPNTNINLSIRKI